MSLSVSGILPLKSVFKVITKTSSWNNCFPNLISMGRLRSKIYVPCYVLLIAFVTGSYHHSDATVVVCHHGGLSILDPDQCSWGTELDPSWVPARGPVRQSPGLPSATPSGASDVQCQWTPHQVATGLFLAPVGIQSFKFPLMPTTARSVCVGVCVEEHSKPANAIGLLGHSMLTAWLGNACESTCAWLACMLLLPHKHVYTLFLVVAYVAISFIEVYRV